MRAANPREAILIDQFREKLNRVGVEEIFGREGDLASVKTDVDDLLKVGPFLRMGAQNVCIALPERYIESGESEPRLGPPACP